MRLDMLKDHQLWSRSTLEETLGITFVEDDAPGLKGTMPVLPRVMQPFGLLHGGASAALVESLGSVAALASIDLDREQAVGVDLQINHLLPVKEGVITARAMPLRQGRRVQVWQVDIYRADGEMSASGRLTVLVSPRFT